jgi:hypothetical protein
LRRTFRGDCGLIEGSVDDDDGDGGGDDDDDDERLRGDRR